MLSVSEEIDGRKTDPLTGNIIGAAIDVQRVLGPGLLESAYEACLLIKAVEKREGMGLTTVTSDLTDLDLYEIKIGKVPRDRK